MFDESVYYKRFSKEYTASLLQAKIAIAGLGGLGSRIAELLTRAGVKHFLLVDFDSVDISNLNRQIYNTTHIGVPKTEALSGILKSINPYVNLKTVHTRVVPENVESLFSEYPIVCEAFDVAENKSMLVNNLLEKTKATIISGSGLAGFGDSNIIHTKKVFNRLYVCGDFETDLTPETPLIAPRVSLVASHMANMIIQLLNK